MLLWRTGTEIILITVSLSRLSLKNASNKTVGLGGEAVSVAVKYKDSAAFKAAGYQDLKVNASYVGGLVRQVGRLSFTRVFDAGQEGNSPHELPDSYSHSQHTHTNPKLSHKSSNVLFLPKT
jgi:hypothetical protein